MEDEQQYIEPLPQPNYGIPSPPNLETVKHYTTLSPFLLEDKDDDESIITGDLPGYIQKYFFAFLSKDFVLTYNDKVDLKLLENKLETAIEAFEMSLAPGRFGWDTIRDLDNLRVVVHGRSRRARDGFERKQENSFYQNYSHTQRMEQVAVQPPNVFQKFGRMIYGGGI